MGLRVALVAGPALPVPPPRYGGTERVIAALGDELHARGHVVTLFASGDSQVSYELVPTLPRSLWPDRLEADPEPALRATVARVWGEHGRFDVIHSHIEARGLELARKCPTPVLTTVHGRLDLPSTSSAFAPFPDAPLVAISEAQRRPMPALSWAATIHHGLPLAQMPFEAGAGEYLLFVGRLAPEKGIWEAIELGRRAGRPLLMAAKVQDRAERRLFQDVVEPAVAARDVTFLGEVGPDQRNRLYAGALATVMMGSWPEPFGLVGIESLACGTPVIARAVGALPEIIEHGMTGFLVNGLQEATAAVERVHILDRCQVRREALRRFSVERMADRYLTVYRSLLNLEAETSAGEWRDAAQPSSSV